MNVEDIYQRIQQLPSIAGAIGRKEPNAIGFLQALYRDVTGQTVVAGCKGCHLKAAHYLNSLTIEKLNTMANKQFKMKDNVLVEFPYRSGQHFTSKNMTDEKAVEFLKAHPDGLKHFSDYPTKDGEVDLGGEVSDEMPPKEVKAKKTVAGKSVKKAEKKVDENIGESTFNSETGENNTEEN